jgi:hypothetical protein
MHEAARTVREAGIEPWMSDACAQRQSWAALFPAALSQDGLAGLLDEMIRQQKQEAQ